MARLIGEEICCHPGVSRDLVLSWKKNIFVYILTTSKNTVLYIGVTNELIKRVFEHRQGIGSKFTKRYNVRKLVYFEGYANVQEAIHREKCLKEWQRAWKIDLIEKMNPEWDDLFER